MKFEIDVEKLVDESVPFNQYLLCQFIYLQESKLLTNYLEQFDKFVTKEDFDSLIERGFLGLNDAKKGYIFSNLYITKHFIDTFIDKPTKSKLDKECVEDWIDIWFNLFPRGVKSGGYLVRSDKNGCLNKMKKFCKRYPDFTKEIILKATKDYLDYYRMKNWNYVSLAHYFISKNDISQLAGFCEGIYEKIQAGKLINLDMSQYEGDSVTYDDPSDLFGTNSMMERL